MINVPTSADIARRLVLLNAILWLSFALFVALGGHPSYGGVPLLRWGITILALLVAAALALLARFLRERSKLAYWLAVASLAGIILAALFDELGLADVLFITITGLPFIMLLRHRSWYLQQPSLPRQ